MYITYHMSLYGPYHVMLLANRPWPCIYKYPSDSTWMVPGTVDPRED